MKSIDLHIIDIVNNSIRAKATQINIELINNKETAILQIIIEDNGSGIEIETLEKIRTNFYSSRKERNIGLGLALLKFHAELTGGELMIESQIGVRTKISAKFKSNHPDMQPIGDVPSVIASFICQYSNIEFIFKYSCKELNFELSTNDVKEVFEDIEINDKNVLNALADLIRNNIDS